MEYLDKIADEEGTFGIEVEFRDRDGNAFTPVTATWRLTDLEGRVINSRSAVVIAGPSATETIVLSALDLAIGTDASAALSESEGGNPPYVERELLVRGTYDVYSDTGLPFRQAIRFKIRNLAGVT